jgi:hypothetical protein
MSKFIVRYSIRHFAQQTPYSERTITRYIEKGKLFPRRTPGGAPYFYGIDVDAFLNHKDWSTPLVCGEIEMEDTDNEGK